MVEAEKRPVSCSSIEFTTEEGPIQEVAETRESSVAACIVTEEPRIDEVVVEADITMGEAEAKRPLEAT